MLGTSHFIVLSFFQTYTCSTSTDFDTEYCTYLDSLTIIVKQTSRSTTSSAKLKVYPKGSGNILGPCILREKGQFERGQTVKFLKFRMPENFAVIYLKFKQRGQTLGYFFFVKKMQME